jgi:transposase
MYAEIGRPSIPPERLLKVSLLISLYSIRGEHAFCEELEYHRSGQSEHQLPRRAALE